MSSESEAIHTALMKSLTFLADDELILAHRDAEWTGHAPILEEDIAFANIAQDELGHASIWYKLIEDLSGVCPDDFIFFREAAEFRNCQLFELPNGDWGRSMMRQYLFDAFELVRCGKLIESEYRPLAQAAAKIRQEEIYHYRHTSSWVRRLGWGTDESNRRMQQSLDFLWRYAQQLFLPSEEEQLLALVGYMPESRLLKDEWMALVVPFLEESNLSIPTDDNPPAGQRNEHSRHLHELVRDLQEVARLDPQAQW